MSMTMRIAAAVAALAIAGSAPGQGAFFGDVKCLPDDYYGGLKHKIVFLPDTVSAPAPTLDGELDDAVWKTAIHLSDFSDQNTGGAPRDPVEAWVARGQDAIYVAIKAAAKIPDYPKGRVQAAGIHGEDFRIMFKPDPARWGRLEFAIGGSGMEWVNGAPSTNVACFKDYDIFGWKPEVKPRALCVRRGDSVVLEAVIPYATLGVPAPARGDEWAFDISRQYGFEFPIPNSKQFGRECCNTIWGGFWGCSHAQMDRWGRIFFGTQKERETAFRPPIARAYLDKVAYDDSDESGEGFIEVLPGSDSAAALSLAAELVDGQGKAVEKAALGSLESGAVGLYINPRALAPGKYVLAARVSASGRTVAEARCPFERIAGGKAPAPRMKEIPLNLFPDPRLGSVKLPVSLGVPFPKGLVTNAAALVLQEAHGLPWKPEWKTIPAQVDVRSRWHRNGSIEWAGVSFEAEYLQGKARSYRLLWDGTNRAARAEKPLVLDETDEAIEVTTGPAKFRILKKAFNLVEAAWLDADGDGKFSDGEKIVQAGGEGGVWYENQSQRMNGAHAETSVRVAECGPERAVVCAEGWYAGGGQRECIHKTRLFFARGSKTVKIMHTWINTVDTRQGGKAREISVKLGVPGVREYAFGSDCGGVYSGSLPPGGIYQVQLSSGKCLVETAPDKPAVAEVGRMAGWLYAGGARGGVSLAGRDLWQLYPKELSVNEGSVGLYLWPIHGREVFSQEEQLKIPRLMQLLSAHQGREMDLQMPKSYYEKLGWYWNRDWEAEEDPKPSSFGPFIAWKMYRGYNASGQGLATSAEMDLTLHAVDEGASAAKRRADILSVNPTGVADPLWTRITDALGPMHEKDMKRFASVEVAMDSLFETWNSQIEVLDDYGMFNWPDLHQYPYDEFNPSARAFHRCWNNNHYQESRALFHLFLRSGEGKYWRFATERARHTMDVDSVNYAEDPPPIRYHLRGANYHPKGIVHWGGDGTVSGHYCNYDYMLYHYYLTGDPRGPELVRMWCDEFSRGVWVAEAERECTAPMAEITYAYKHFRDPRMLKALNLFKEAMLSAPPAGHQIPWFNALSWWRVYRQTGDRRVVDLLVENWNDGSPRKNGIGRALEQWLVFSATGDRRVVAGATVPAANFLNRRFLCPPAEPYFWIDAPYAMSMFEQADATGDLMSLGRGSPLWEKFWKADLDKWRAENKLINGRKP